MTAIVHRLAHMIVVDLEEFFQHPMVDGEAHYRLDGLLQALDRAGVLPDSVGVLEDRYLKLCWEDKKVADGVRQAMVSALAESRHDRKLFEQWLKERGKSAKEAADLSAQLDDLQSDFDVEGIDQRDIPI